MGVWVCGCVGVLLYYYISIEYMQGAISLLSSIPISYLFALLSGFSWALTTIITKQYLLKLFDPMELYILRMGVGFPILALLITLIISLVSFKRVGLNNNYFTSILKKASDNYSNKMLFVFILSIIAGFFGLYMFWKVLEINHGSYSVAFVWPLVVLFTTLISYFFYDEKITQIQGLGIGIIMLGLVLINIE